MNRPRILLADDHQIVAEGLKRILEAEFELIAIVADGKALVETFESQRPDVIVADITMPGLSGIDALELLKRIDPDVRLVFLTMHREIAYARRAIEAGAYGFVLKHSAAAELVLAVRAALQRKTFIAPSLAGELMHALRHGGDAPSDPVAMLTQRQREILRLLVEGQSAKRIAGALDISARTVEFHKYRMMESLDLQTTAELIHFAIKNGLAGS